MHVTLHLLQSLRVGGPRLVDELLRLQLLRQPLPVVLDERGLVLVFDLFQLLLLDLENLELLHLVVSLLERLILVVRLTVRVKKGVTSILWIIESWYWLSLCRSSCSICCLR